MDTETGGSRVANRSTKNKRKNTAWQRSRPMGAMPAVIALIGVAALALTWLAQSAPFFALKQGASAAGSGLRISEVMSANASTLVGNDLGIEDWIEIQNTSDQPIDLTGYAIVRQTKPAQAFAFPGGVLQPGEYLLVHADGSGKALQADGYHAPFRLPASGETIALLSKGGDRCQYHRKHQQHSQQFLHMGILLL